MEGECDENLEIGCRDHKYYYVFLCLCLLLFIYCLLLVLLDLDIFGLFLLLCVYLCV